jgi:hypothetical protein
MPEPTKRRSIEPTYDSRETGPRYHVTTRLGDRTTEFQKPIPDPFVAHTVRLTWRGILRCLLDGKRPAVTVIVSGDWNVVEDVLELDANHLGYNSTRRDEFNISLGAALHTFGALDA